MRLESFEANRKVEGLLRAHALEGQAQRRKLAWIAECDDPEIWEPHGAHGYAQWLSAQLGISNYLARRLIACAHAIARLPRISDALETGVLSLDKVRELTRFATPETEGKLIRWAKRVSVRAIKDRGDLELRPDVEPDKGEYRSLRLQWGDDNQWLTYWGQAPRAQAVVIIKELDRIARQIPDLPDDSGTMPERSDTLDQRRADALYALCSRGLALDGDPDRATVVAHVDLNDLVSLEHGGTLDDIVVSPEVLSRVACDARIEKLLHDDDGRIVGMASVHHDPPAWMRRAVRDRDKACLFPGCEHRLFTHIHHIVSWPKGPTKLSNLALLCAFHHRLVHEYGWTMKLGPPGTAEWFKPDGSRYDPVPAIHAPELSLRC